MNNYIKNDFVLKKPEEFLLDRGIYVEKCSGILDIII